MTVPPSERIYVIEIGGVPILAFAATSHREAQSLLREEWLKAEPARRPLRRQTGVGQDHETHRPARGRRRKRNATPQARQPWIRQLSTTLHLVDLISFERRCVSSRKRESAKKT